MLHGTTGRLSSYFTEPLFSIPVGILIIIVVIVAGPA